jgi:hypothetical protein
MLLWNEVCNESTSVSLEDRMRWLSVGELMPSDPRVSLSTIMLHGVVHVEGAVGRGWCPLNTNRGGSGHDA